jgi:D-alanyl-D-alanine carboxypeptidase
MRKGEHTLTTSRRTLTVHTTNRLVGSEIDVLAGKTGFIRSAGYCLATLVRLPQTNEELAFVVLGAKSSSGRFWETRHLFNWINQRTGVLMGGEPAVESPLPQEVPQALLQELRLELPQEQPQELR